MNTVCTRGESIALALILMIFPLRLVAGALSIQPGDKEKIEALERISSWKFHQQLNQFRKANKVDTLAWHPVLSKAALNHNLWMSQNTFSHKEKEGTPGYTGTDPWNRVQKLRGEALSSYMIGENIVYFTFSDPQFLSPDDAEDLARKAFELWENSPGHRSNMLHEGYLYHGISFHINEYGSVYGTSVFSGTLPPIVGKPGMSQNSEAPSVSPIQSNSEQPVSLENMTAGGSSTSQADVRVLSKNLEKEMKAFVRQLIVGYSLNASLNEAAAAHLLYVLTHGTTSSEEEKSARNFSGATPHRRLKKVLGLRGMLLGKPEWTTDWAFYHKVPDLTEDAVHALVKEFQEGSRQFLEQAGKGYIGYALRVQKKKDGYLVGAVLMHTRHRL
jgi:uncharacterized protein YkwD